MDEEAIIDTLPETPPSLVRRQSLTRGSVATRPPKPAEPSDPASPNLQPPLPDPSTISLVVSDVDGTLLDPHHKLTANTAATIRKLLDKRPDLRFVVCTGKARPATLSIRQEIGLDVGKHAGRHPCIHVNGCVTYSGDQQIVSQTLIDRRVGKWLLQMVEGYPTPLPDGLDPLLSQLTLAPYTGSVVRVSRPTRFADLLRDNYGETVLVHSKEPSGQHDEGLDAAMYHDKMLSGEIGVNKWCVCGEDEALNAFRDVFLKPDGVPSELRELFTLTEAVPHIVELCPPSASKGTALKALLEDLKLKPENCLALGDGDNDAPMFEVAGYSVAMNKCMKRAKELSTWWEGRGNGRDGLAEWLKVMFRLEVEEADGQLVN